MVYFHNEPHADRIVAGFDEQPAMRLTALQAARLFSLPVEHVEPLLRLLVSDGRLSASPDGRYSALPGARRSAATTEAA